MVWALLTVLLIAAVGGALYAIRSLQGGRPALPSTAQRLALPLAVIERACTDAVEELCRAAADEAPLFVSPFDPITHPIAAVPQGALRALGDDADEEHAQLVTAMQRWNAAAGTKSTVERLLPTMLVAHEAAARLARRIEGQALQVARRFVEGRVLVGLVASAPQEGALLH